MSVWKDKAVIVIINNKNDIIHFFNRPSFRNDSDGLAKGSKKNEKSVIRKTKKQQGIFFLSLQVFLSKRGITLFIFHSTKFIDSFFWVTIFTFFGLFRRFQKSDKFHGCATISGNGRIKSRIIIIVEEIHSGGDAVSDNIIKQNSFI